MQRNLSRFQRYFGKRFFVADNNTGDDLTPITKAVRRAIFKPVKNPIASAWIAGELQKKKEQGKEQSFTQTGVRFKTSRGITTQVKKT